MFEIALLNGKKAYFPFLKALDIKFDFDKKEVLVDSKKLDGVIFYED